MVQVPVQGGEWDCRGYIELNRARNGLEGVVEVDDFPALRVVQVLLFLWWLEWYLLLIYCILLVFYYGNTVQ